MTNSWDPPPSPSDPWGRTSQNAPPQDPWGQSTFGQPTQQWDGMPQEVRLPLLMGPPSLAPTVVVTALFGLFGVIPASVHAARARSIGWPGGRYWKAFGITLAVTWALWIGAIVLLVSMLPSLLLGLLPATSTASGPAYRPTSPAAPAATIPSREPYSPTPTVPGSTDRTVTSLPSGSWITVLDSLAKHERSEADAWAMATALSRASAPVVVVDTDAVRSLTPGYWAVAVTGSTTRTEAADLCVGFGRPLGATCYPRQAA